MCWGYVCRACVSPSVKVELCYSELEREVILNVLVQHKLFPLDFWGSLERAKWRNVECLHSCWCPMVFNIQRNAVRMWTSTLSLEVHICLQLWHEALPISVCVNLLSNWNLSLPAAATRTGRPCISRFKGTRSFQKEMSFPPVNRCSR